ncbi:MAG: S8 family serine peptidase, partial [Nanoarchaeota archaeon]|nr:S8 family serine peptidase [Nanoarchaeota archaeon]
MNEKRKIIVKDISPSLISQRQTREILMSLTLECFFALYIVGFLVVILLVVGVMAEETSKVDDSVYSALNNKDYVPVVIKVKEDTKKSMFFTQNSTKEVEENLENEPLGRYRNLIAANISKEELDKLENLGSIERIEYAPSFKAMLQDSVGVVNASRSWSLKLSGSNITGADETVCVIDTGIDFSHPDLIGKNKTCIIDCFNKACIENCSLADANGHGTHVAGIIAASPGIRGVAFSAGLIGVRVLDSSGGSSDTPTLDLKRAIDWCIQNRLNYNISVISMSLGTSTLYDSACDSDFSATWTRAINNATYYNISVISASGNADSGPRNTTHISAPACITNVTAVSATDKNDAISSYGHYGTMVDLFAPGTSINSTYPGNGYAILSGTSMSTPQVAAAFALIREFYRLQTGLVYTPLQIQTAFQNNGKNISGSGLNFTRINIYDTIISLDSQSPNVLLITPQNNSAVLNRNQTFRCNSTDISLKNITFFLWNSTGLVNS